MHQAPEDELIDDIYAAALDVRRWENVVERLADALGAGQACMTRLNHVDGLGEAITARIDPAYLEAYNAHFHTRNVFTIMDDLQAWIRGWRPLVLRTNDALPVDDYHRTEYFNDFMRPQGSVGTLHIRLDLDQTMSSAIALGKPVGRGEFDDDMFEKAVRLQPHLIRAYRLGRALSGGFGISQDLARALEASPQAIFIVDQDSVVRHANPAGETLLGARKGLTVLNGRLAALQPDPSKRLGELIARATTRDGVCAGGSLSMPRPGLRFPLALKVAPLRTEQIPIFSRPRLALVCATDLEVAVRSPEDELIALFGLTRAEARVATAVFQGLSLKEAAEQFGVSFNTVRFQYARLAEKTGVTRQAELVKLMMRLASGPEG